MSENKKCRLAEVLGVEVGEKFGVAELPATDDARYRYYVDSGRCVVDLLGGYMSGITLAKIINGDYHICRNPKSRFTDEEKTVLRAMYEAGVSEIRRGDSDALYWRYTPGGGKNYLPFRLLPSIVRGEPVRLAELFGEEAT